MSNPFGLIYGGAIEANEPGKVNIRPVRYTVDGIEAAANLYLPADYSEKNKKKYPAVTVAHPNGGCKEQVAGLYAQRLAELGFITLACDARYQGESGGEPRLRDYPANRIGDVSGMVDYLSQVPKVDFSRIGALGICGGGGYTLACLRPDRQAHQGGGDSLHVQFRPCPPQRLPRRGQSRSAEASAAGGRSKGKGAAR